MNEHQTSGKGILHHGTHGHRWLRVRPLPVQSGAGMNKFLIMWAKVIGVTMVGLLIACAIWLFVGFLFSLGFIPATAIVFLIITALLGYDLSRD